MPVPSRPTIDQGLVEAYDPHYLYLFRSAAEQMSPFAVAIRSPNPENVPTEEEAHGLMEQVDAIRAEVQERLPFDD